MAGILQEICQRFDDAWTKDEHPRIEDYLAELPQEQRMDVARQLIAIDMRRRIASGETPSAQDYAGIELKDGQHVQATCVTTYTGGESDAQEDAAPSSMPQQIGRYRIQRLLGAGGYGFVVAALDEELDRIVAIKIPTARATAGHLARQLNEARAAAKLSHRGIVAVYDCGRLPDERFYIVSEFVDGQTLAAAIKDERLPLRRAVEIMIELAEAVHNAHLHGLFHRDLKPSNILIDRHGQARITDFGLVIDENEQYRFAGEIAGSPAYMSPEQVLGQSHFLDGRSDIWSLGVIFYELLTGRRPFRGPLEHLRKEILERPPRPPRQIDDAIPGELERCCLKCLERSLTQRYSSALDLANDLRAWTKQDKEAVSVRPTPGRPLLPRYVLAGVLLLICIAAVTLAWNFLFKGTVINAGKMQPASAELRSGTAPKGIWIPLLDQEPRVLHWPLVPQNSERIYRAAEREMTLSSDQFAMIELGRTTARDFRFRTRLHQAAWTGNAGIFWGYRERDGTRESQYQTVWLQPYQRSARQRRPFQTSWKSLLVTADGHTSADRSLQSWENEPPPGQEIEFEIVLRNGRLAQIFWNGADLGKIECRDPKVEPGPDDCIGAFGVVIDGSSILIRNPAFYLLE